MDIAEVNQSEDVEKLLQEAPVLRLSKGDDSTCHHGFIFRLELLRRAHEDPRDAGCKLLFHTNGEEKGKQRLR
jgi:hypothetical protein